MRKWLRKQSGSVASCNPREPVRLNGDEGGSATLIAVRSDEDGQAIYAFDIRLQGGQETIFFDI